MNLREKYHAEGISVRHSVDNSPDDRSFPLHMHDNYELFCFVSGKCSYVVEGTPYELRPGTLLIMRSSETHKLLVHGGERYERFTMNFYPEVLLAKGLDPQLLAPFRNRASGEKNIYEAEQLGEVQMIELFRKMCRECEILPKETAIYANLLSMLCAVACGFERYPEGHAYKGAGDMQREVLNYINDHLTEELSMETIAKYVHISPTQLGRLFKRWTDTTLHQYILSKRLILAQTHLVKGEKAVVAARKSGFGDYSCFYRSYKKRFGCAPGDGKPKAESR